MPTWQGYIREARKFWSVAQAFDRPGYTNQAVSNAVYAVIAATDAIGVQRIGESAGDHSHDEILSLLGRACSGTPLESELAPRMEQLRHVLEHDPSAHPGKTLDVGLARVVMEETGEFIAWVERTLSEGTG